MHRLLLRLLPRRHREAYGPDLALVFTAQCDDARAEGGVRGVMSLWIREAIGLLIFAWRARRGPVIASTRRDGRATAGTGGSGINPGQELRWALRGVRARGWHAALAVVLMALALSATALVFATADALVFNRVPYRDPATLVAIGRATRYGADTSLTPPLYDAWRSQPDLFADVEAYLTKTVFLSGDGLSALESASDVTPGLIAMLGVRPRYGRLFNADDTRRTDVLSALVSESLAAERFGSPALAVGRRLETTAQTLEIVGVLPDHFRFPFASIRIWRAMDPRGPLTANFAGVFSIARLAPGVTFDRAAVAMTLRSAAIARAAGAPASYSASPMPLDLAQTSADARRFFLLLLGAAVCLLLTACANIAGLELATAVRRARTFAIQLALGATRGSLARVAALEGACLAIAALLVAAGLTLLGIRALEAYLPKRMLFSSVNPIAFGGRTVAALAIAAAGSWLFASLPVVVFAARPSLVTLLKLEGPSTASSRTGVRVRRVLTAAEVALALMLLVGGVLYGRTYIAQISIDKGFDSRNLVTIGTPIPPQMLSERRAATARLLDRLKTMPGVVDVTDQNPPPSFNSPSASQHVDVDDRPPTDEHILLATQPVQPSYFSLFGIPLRSGRWFEPNESPRSVLVTESFARRYWPDGHAAGHRIRSQVSGGWYDVVGVVGDVLGDRPHNSAGDPWFVIFTPAQPPPPPRPRTPDEIRAMATGGMYGLLNVTVRLDSMSRASSILQAAQSMDPRFHMTLESVDDDYAAAYADTLLATRIVSSFGVLAFVLAAAGIYGVMSFLVAGQRREIGIRMALGADARDVHRLVVGSALRFVVPGAAIGLVAAILVAHWLRAALYGVTPTDPATYVFVTMLVTLTALAATWSPARTAARVDPAKTLRTD